ncbi:MAG: protein-export chaperone SecB [Gemmatimonadota bacterium]
MKDETKPPGIRISQIFTVRSFFEHNGIAAEMSPLTPVGEIVTSIKISIGVEDSKLAGFVSVSVETSPESTGLYRFHVEIMGVMEADADSNMSLEEYLRGAGPPTLFPFAREAVAALTGKGRFGPVWLPPFNFAAVAAQLTEKQLMEKGKDAIE